MQSFASGEVCNHLGMNVSFHNPYIKSTYAILNFVDGRSKFVTKIKKLSKQLQHLIDAFIGQCFHDF